jgi:hypothetical protein
VVWLPLPPRVRCPLPPSQARRSFCRWLAAHGSGRCRSSAPDRCWCAVGPGSGNSGTDPSSSSWLPSKTKTPLHKAHPLVPCGRTSPRATFGSPGATLRRSGPLRRPGCALPDAPTSSTGGWEATAHPSLEAHAQAAPAAALAPLGFAPLFTHPLHGVPNGPQTLVELYARG